ncbi:MAG: SCO family protein, partial [Actinomycetia bacterium]|nr:SCO family protein [Actinomycetes bacterium]
RALVASAVLGAVVASCAPPTSSDADDGDSPGSGSTSSAFIDTSDGPSGPANQELDQTDGSTWSFRSDDVTLLYFGYTSCPDVCPTTMADLAVALRALPEAAADVTVRFVTTDPRRDTLRQLRTWLKGFDPDFVGARAPIGQVVEAAEQYGIGIEPPKVTKGNYEVTHGAQVLALRPDGRSVGYFREGTTPAQFERLLPDVIEEAS